MPLPLLRGAGATKIIHFNNFNAMYTDTHTETPNISRKLSARPGYLALRATGAYADGSPRLLREISNEGRSDADAKAAADAIRLVFFYPTAALRLLKVLDWFKMLGK